MVEKYVIFAGILLALGVAAWAGAVLLTAQAILRPPRLTDAKAVHFLKRLTPADLDLAYEEVTFVVSDERTGKPLRLAGWWMPSEGARGRCIVLLHDYGDAKVAAIEWAPMLRSLGFNLLAIDFRAHGQSEGAYCSAGFFERHDLDQAINQFRAARPDATQQVVIFGLGLGATTAAAVAAMRQDLSAVVLACPPDDDRAQTPGHVLLMGLPGTFVQRPAIGLAEWLSGADFDLVRLATSTARIGCPVLVIGPGDDQFEHELARAARPVYHPEEYRQRLETFLRDALEGNLSIPQRHLRPLRATE